MADDVAREGQRAVSFRRLRETLLARHAGDVTFATDLFCRLALARTIEPRLLSLSHDALTAMRAAHVPFSALDGMGARGRDLSLFGVPETVPARAALLRGAVASLARLLRDRGLVDPREADALLAARVAEADPEALAVLVGRRLDARLILDRSAAELAWYRSLDERLRRVRGFARFTVPHVPMAVDTTRAHAVRDRRR